MASITPTYNSPFPALYAVGSTRQDTNHHQGSSAFSPTIHRSLAPPKYPSYLKQTSYAALALEQYNFYQRKHNWKSVNGRTQSLPKTSTLEDEQMEELDLCLPTFWNSKDKSKNIEVGSNGLDLSYTGPGKQETHAALARSNFPMRYQCGIFYYEMKVISKGNDGYIGIGVCCASNKLERLPGWDPDSWGYHGDDGHSFAGSGTGKNYGPCFSTGDVVGCGVNFADNSAFYTKNGKFLGIAFTGMNLTKPIYAAIGLRTPGEQVTANFGYEPFLFDIAQYVGDQKSKFLDEIITKMSTPNVYKDSRSVVELQDKEIYSKEVMDQLILSYLIHHGYTGTAKAVVQNAGHVSGQELFLSDASSDIFKLGEKDMEERQVIRSAIVNGKIDEAIRLIDTYFPGVLQEEGRGQELQLWLKCGRFVEMMREFCEYNKNRRLNPISENSDRITRSKIYSSDSLGLDVNMGEDKSRSISVSSVDSSIPTPNKGRRLNYAAIAASLSPSSSTEINTTAASNDHNRTTDIMDIDDAHTTSNEPLSGRGTSISGAENISMSGENENEASDSLKLVMQYGKKVQEEYRHDTREKTRSSLVEIFSLLAYPDPYCSPVAYLMNISRRDALATEVNASILAFQNRPEMPAMERIYRQIVLSNKELACEGNGKAALINIDDYFANDLETVDYRKSFNLDPMVS